MAINDVAVCDILPKSLGHNSVYGFRTLKPKYIFKNLKTLKT